MKDINAHLLRTADAAKHLGTAASTLRRWAASGKSPIRFQRLNGRIYWLAADVRAAVEGRL